MDPDARPHSPVPALGGHRRGFLGHGTARRNSRHNSRPGGLAPAAKLGRAQSGEGAGGGTRGRSPTWAARRRAGRTCPTCGGGGPLPSPEPRGPPLALRSSPALRRAQRAPAGGTAAPATLPKQARPLPRPPEGARAPAPASAGAGRARRPTWEGTLLARRGDPRRRGRAGGAAGPERRSPRAGRERGHGSARKCEAEGGGARSQWRRPGAGGRRRCGGGACAGRGLRRGGVCAGSRPAWGPRPPLGPHTPSTRGLTGGPGGPLKSQASRPPPGCRPPSQAQGHGVDQTGEVGGLGDLSAGRGHRGGTFAPSPSSNRSSAGRIAFTYSEAFAGPLC